MSSVGCIVMRPWLEHCRVVVGTLDDGTEVWCKQLCLVDLDHWR